MSTPKIQVLSEGAYRGKSFELPKDSYSVGRAEDRDLCVSDSTISSRHATIFKDEAGTVYLRDEGSTNGSRINGDKVEAGVDMKLHNGDIFQLGGVEFLFDSGEETRAVANTTSVINLDNVNTSELSGMKLNNLGDRVRVNSKDRYRRNRGQIMGMRILMAIVGLGVLFAVCYVVYGILMQ